MFKTNTRMWSSISYLNNLSRCYMVLFVFDTQNTAYELRISDWSSDVRTSDLLAPGSFGIVIGDEAAAKLGAAIGDKLTFVAPEVTVTPGGMRSVERRVG